VLARKLGYVQVIEHTKTKDELALNYKDTPAAKMEETRQPRRVKRLKINVNTK
jgi:hypothetical protein